MFVIFNQKNAEMPFKAICLRSKRFFSSKIPDKDKHFFLTKSLRRQKKRIFSIICVFYDGLCDNIAHHLISQGIKSLTFLTTRIDKSP